MSSHCNYSVLLGFNYGYINKSSFFPFIKFHPSSKTSPHGVSILSLYCNMKVHLLFSYHTSSN